MWCLEHSLSGLLSYQGLHQGLSLLEVGRIKTLAEPVVYWCQKLRCGLAFPLLLPEATEAHRGPQSQGFCALLVCYFEGLAKASFRLSIWSLGTRLSEARLQD